MSLPNNSPMQNLIDLAITQKIRKALVADKSLSAYAHNAKIITAHGVVTLKGPVKKTRSRKSRQKRAKSLIQAR